MEEKKEFEVEPFYVKDLVFEFFKQWRVIVGIFAVVLTMTVLWLGSVDRIYKASVVLRPVSGINPGGNAAGGLGQLGALGSLVGIGGGETTIFAEHLALLRSPELARRLDEKHNLRIRLFSSMWDAENEVWVPSSGIVSSFKRGVKSLLGYPDWTPPDDVSLQKALSLRLAVINHSVGTELKRVEWAYSDADYAGKVLQWMVDEANLILREQRLTETRQQIIFLTERLETARNSYQKDALAQILLEQERTNLLLHTPTGPGASIFDPVIVERNPIYPKITMTILLAIFAAGMISIGYVYFTLNSPKNRSH
jgi:hypothetical protein